MKSAVSPGSVKIWYRFLQIAIREGLPIDHEKYRDWGTPEEIARTAFDPWWKRTGRQLFASYNPVLELIETSLDFVIVKIPTALGAIQVKKQVSALMTKQRGTKRLKKKTTQSFVGDVQYKTLIQYERYLKIELDPKNSNKTVEEKTEMLRDVYRKIKARLVKQKATLQAAKKTQISKKLVYREPDSFSSEKEIRKGIDAKKVSRWRLSAQLVLLNVAEGQFPGRGYYGAKLAQKLKDRLHEMGIERIGVVARNKGGGRTREELTQIKAGRSKRERELASLQAYGKGKDANQVGDDVQGS